ncbi:uncharacterized protein LOC123682212 isoform X4 [Harmonia axyridis]|uniref:uncharacterized protein LOC123682212 isoform X4 n=1 Tax=Harmonia axyridis TaxID=115357 RepID=UPI001E276E8D|nr:uncharacterized protein LOC123682212 isoform X4 [Harmonia axyridis]
MRYLVIFVIICVLICNDVDAKKKKKKKDKENEDEVKEVKEIECIQCETDFEKSDCRNGTESDTCIGKYCLYYTTDERFGDASGGSFKKYWWKRGCTKKKKTCKNEEFSNCVVCNETRCNTEPLPTMYPVIEMEAK